MKKNKFLSFIIFISVVIIHACSKTDDTSFVNYKDYVNFKKGKFIIYKLDSTVTYSFGAGFTKRSYLIKDSIVDVIEDDLGQTSYKIFRYQYDSVLKKWNSVNSFLSTTTKNTMEYIENNLRYIKLVDPVSDGKTWRGNAYINSFLFHENDNYPNWIYAYENVGVPKTIGNFNFSNTVTVVQYDSLSIYNTPFYKLGYTSYTKAYEVYADTVGLVYKDVLCWEYQPSITFNNCRMLKPSSTNTYDTISINCNYCDQPNVNCDSLATFGKVKFISDTSLVSYFYNGFGITQTIVSHN